MSNRSHISLVSGILLTLMLLASLVESQKSSKQTRQKESNNPIPSLLSDEIDSDVRTIMKNMTNTLSCNANSPVHKLKYNFTQVSSIKNADFCHQYTTRTCCSIENLNQLRMQLYKMMYMNQDLSNQCQQALHQLICYDCDGDVGQGLRKGICTSQCDSLYDVCKDDYFVLDQTTAGKIRICQRSDLVCSKLSDIVSADKKSDFCQLLGYDVTPMKHSEYSDWFFQFYKEDYNHTLASTQSTDPAAAVELESFKGTIEPICWDFTPSSSIFGKAANVVSTASTTSSKSNSETSSKGSQLLDPNGMLIRVLTIVLYVLIGFIAIVGAMYAWLSWKSKRLISNKSKGVRIGGSEKNPYQ